jgi:dimethylaniline monooxygenase (N-oxide forming)
MMLKNLKDDGFDVTLYESRSWVGGLWKYSNDDSLSTAENTAFNTSKYRTAISDFPVPESMADFPPAEQLHGYLESYCDRFDLWPHIELNSPVNTIKRQDNQWILEIGKNPDSRSDAFDKVALSCGSFIIPRQPDFKDIDHFTGQTMHAINYHQPVQFKGKRVLVVGLHASAQDVVSSLSKYASHVYLSHRSGIVMVILLLQAGFM